MAKYYLNFCIRGTCWVSSPGVVVSYLRNPQSGWEISAGYPPDIRRISVTSRMGSVNFTNHIIAGAVNTLLTIHLSLQGVQRNSKGGGRLSGGENVEKNLFKILFEKCSKRGGEEKEICRCHPFFISIKRRRSRGVARI